VSAHEFPSRQNNNIRTTAEAVVASTVKSGKKPTPKPKPKPKPKKKKERERERAG
jgi:hypothetical protein